MIVLKKYSNNFLFKIKNSYIPIDGSLIPYLTEDMTLEDGVTFEDFFNIILKHHEEYSKFFYSHLGGIELKEFIEEWNKPVTREPKDDGMQKIVVSWDKHYLLNDDELKTEGIEIHWLASFHGIGQKDGNTVGYAVEFTPINELKRYPMQLIEDSAVINLQTDKQLFTIERTFTIYDILSAIFYEITYCGLPYERESKLNEIKQMQYDIKEEFEDTGEDDKNNKSLDDLLKKLKIDKSKE